MTTVVLTIAQLTALKAVRDGKVRHSFGIKGNVYRGHSGHGSRCFHALERLRLIEDECGNNYATTFGVRLTKLGQDAISIGGKAS